MAAVWKDKGEFGVQEFSSNNWVGQIPKTSIVWVSVNFYTALPFASVIEIVQSEAGEMTHLVK